MTLALAVTALGLGFRHGIDWDHIAAITDFSSATPSRRRAFGFSTLYALGHAAVVLVLGLIAIHAGSYLPRSADVWMGRIGGLTLIVLGVWVIVELIRRRDRFRLRSRVMLIAGGAFAGIRRVRSTAALRSLTVRHEHQHEHTHAAEPHDHSHEGLVRSVAYDLEAAPTGAGTRPSAGASTTPAARLLHHRHTHRHDLVLADSPFASYGNTSAAGIGVLHGVGIETPTQVAVFVAANQVGGAVAATVLLGIWVFGLLAANSLIAFIAAFGLVSPERSFRIYATVAVVVAVFSIVAGVAMMIGVDHVLPALA